MTCLLQMAWRSGSCTVPHHFHTKLVLYPQAGRDSGRKGRLLTGWDRKGAGLRVLRAAAATAAAAALGAAAVGLAPGVVIAVYSPEAATAALVATTAVVAAAAGAFALAAVAVAEVADAVTASANMPCTIGGHPNR